MPLMQISTGMIDTCCRLLDDAAKDPSPLPETLLMISTALKQCKELDMMLSESVEEQRQDST